MLVDTRHKLDLDVDAGEVQTHQESTVLRWAQDVDQALMGAHLR